MKNCFHFLFFILLVTGCSKCRKHEEKKDLVKPENVDDHIPVHISDFISDIDPGKTTRIFNDTLAAKQLLKKWYSQSDYRHTWTLKGELVPAADSLILAIKNAWEYGLDPDFYHSSLIDSMYHSRRIPGSARYDAVRLADLDILFSG